MALLKRIETFYINPNDPLQFFEQNLNLFKKRWASFCIEIKSNNKIPKEKFIAFFRKLEEPLGLFLSNFKFS
jgi:hypothetical protein